MATVQVLCWKNIPSMVQVTDGTGTVKLQLSDRFQILIDDVAMHLGLAGTDAYLDQWQRRDDEERPGPAHEVAESVAAELERRFEEFRVALDT